MKIVDLSGKWICKDENGAILGTVTLPGSSCEGKIGKKQEYYDEYKKEYVRAPRERYEYIGKLYYEKEVEIPEEFDHLDCSVFLERVNIASKLWIDGVQAGRGVIGLSTPHRYRLSDRVDSQGRVVFPKLSGKHLFRLEVDNSNFLNLGDMSSGYSVDTQGYWNGVIGKMELRGEEICHIESLQVYPTDGGLDIKTVTLSDRHQPMLVKKGALKYELTLPDGRMLTEKIQDIEVFSRRQRNHFSYPLAEQEIIRWDEFHPQRYELKVTLKVDGIESSYVQKFGYRKLEVKDKKFLINGRPLSLRGTINCAQYPLTGYPPMDTETWLQHFRMFQAHGLNHVRCHAWCPPEAAFEAADQLGIYLSVEMPLWINRDVTPYEFGDDEWHEVFFRTEGLRMLEAYGNHPSFCFFPNGNENMGDYAMLETMSKEWKALDPRHLYTLTSNFDHPLSPEEDYMSAFEIQHYKARIQFLQDEVGESTSVAYNEMAENVPVPFASFEVGQYCVYPNVDLCERYTGNMMPVNLDLIRKMMKEKGVYGRLQDFILASGDLAAKLYKEDIEAVMRTRGMGGFQLLSLVDYTGQSTAMVGMLDIFHESKGVIAPEKWKEFCCEVVPLFEARRIFKAGETLEAKVSLYDYSEHPIQNPCYQISLVRACDETVYAHQTVHGEGKLDVQFDLSEITENTQLNVVISVQNGEKTYTNSWRIFVYKEEKQEENLKVISTPEELEKAKEQGGQYIAVPSAFPKATFARNSFIPVFWSPVHFPSTDPCGAMINPEDPMLKNFPTEKYIDYQWKDLLEHSVSMNKSDLPSDARIVMEMVPNFVDNVEKSPLAEFTYGKARIIFCGFDLERDNLPTKALKQSLKDYLRA